MPQFADILDLEYELDTAQILDQLEVVGLADDVKGAVIANIILERFGTRQRRFSYKDPIDPQADGCVAHYARSLQHGDWVNGQDVVNADEFNDRFHRIETDLDAAARDAATALDCLMDLRAQLAVALEEVKGQINLLHADVHDLREKHEQTPAPRPYPVPWKPVYGVGPVSPGVPFAPDTTGPILRDPGLWSDIVGGRVPIDAGLGFGGGMGPLINPGSQGVWTLRGKDDVGTIGGMPATRLANGEFNGDTVEVWSTPAGMFLTPISKTEDARQGYIDPRIEMGGRFSAWIEENSDKIEEAFRGDSFTAAQFEEKFGGQSIGAGLRVGEALKGFSGGTKFVSPEALNTRFTERQSERILESGAGVAAKIGAVGLTAGDGGAAKTKIENFAAIPADARKFLAENGIETIEKFGGAKAAEVARKMNQAGVSADAAAVASWKGMARIVAGLG